MLWARKPLPSRPFRRLPTDSRLQVITVSKKHYTIILTSRIDALGIKMNRLPFNPLTKKDVAFALIAFALEKIKS